LKIRYQNEADTINFQCEGSDDRLADFDLKLMQIESGKVLRIANVSVLLFASSINLDMHTR